MNYFFCIVASLAKDTVCGRGTSIPHERERERERALDRVE
jgi:hypothetical protein